jgi:hypothetical protein
MTGELRAARGVARKRHHGQTDKLGRDYFDAP